ncbi:MAG: hypothetical protein KDE27_31935 [Planctomycetes bacterium]|nr:hypothetical protein [Planctomycetota bacterium]
MVGVWLCLAAAWWLLVSLPVALFRGDFERRPTPSAIRRRLEHVAATFPVASILSVTRSQSAFRDYLHRVAECRSREPTPPHLALILHSSGDLIPLPYRPRTEILEQLARSCANCRVIPIAIIGGQSPFPGVMTIRSSPENWLAWFLALAPQASVVVNTSLLGSGNQFSEMLFVNLVLGSGKFVQLDPDGSAVRAFPDAGARKTDLDAAIRRAKATPHRELGVEDYENFVASLRPLGI